MLRVMPKHPTLDTARNPSGTGLSGTDVGTVLSTRDFRYIDLPSACARSVWRLGI